MSQDRLAAAIGDRYSLVSELGEGGMATVYLAVDLKHDRKVAIKVLKPHLAASIGAERFLNEIRLTARFNHPNILQLFDSGDADGLLYYVMPYVEGESLRSRLERARQLSVDDAVGITRGVASALHYAHEQGVVHRDIKPENILLHAGQPLVADFGIALAVASMDATRLTAIGTSVGSPTYMSPEQAAGDRELDRRTDVYALACVLYEMLSGDPPFTGSNVQTLTAKIITQKPTPIRRLRPNVPASVESALERALEKVPGDRFATVADFSHALGSGTGRWGGNARAWRTPALIAAAVLVILAAGRYLAARASMTPAPSSAQRKHTQLTFSGQASSPAVSPDGQSVAYVERDMGPGSDAGRLMLLDLGGGQAVEIARDTHMLMYPKWRPDGKAILFFAGMSADKHQHGLYVVPRLGGEPRLVHPEGVYPSYDWSPDGQRIAVVDKAVLKVLDMRLPQPVVDSASVKYGSATGGTVAWAPKSDWLAIQTRAPGRSGIRVLDLKGAPRDSIRANNASGPLWHPSGEWLYFGDAESPSADLRKVRFDPRTGRFVDQPMPAFADPRELHMSAVWDDGAKALYTVRTRASHLFQLPLTRAGAGSTTQEKELTRGTASYSNPSLSRDAKWMAYKKLSPNGADLYVRPVDEGAERRVTTNGKLVRDAAWSPDGTQLAFGMLTDSGSVPMIVPVAGGVPRRVGTRRSGHGGVPRQFAWSPDGKRLLYLMEGHQDFMIVDLATNQERLLIGEVQQGAYGPVFSPDGQRVVLQARVRGGQSGLWVVDLRDNSRGLLTGDLGDPLAWTGDTILYEFKNTIWTIPSRGGRMKAYARIASGCDDIAFAAGQSWIVCSRGEYLADIWLLEAFDPR